MSQVLLLLLPRRLVSSWLMVTDVPDVCICWEPNGLRFERQELFRSDLQVLWCVRLGFAEGVKAGSFTPTLPLDASPPFPFSSLMI